MSFIPVLWNRFNQKEEDSDGMFHFLEDWNPMPVSWFYDHPMIQRINRPETSLADRKWNYSVQIGDFNAEQVKVKVEDGKVLFTYVMITNRRWHRL